jgi:dCTP deaminase
MILTGEEIRKQVGQEHIKIVPFNHNQVTTNSYDVRLGKTLIRYTSDVLNPKLKPDFEEIEIPEEGLVLEAGSFHLGSTAEKIGSNFFVPILHAKSGTARKGLFVHVTADLIDIGYFGNFTLQLYATIPVKIYPNMLIAQVTFWEPTGEITLYNGKYQSSEKPRVSEIYKDFLIDKK